MRDTWCAECGAYVEHDPWSAHHVVVDGPYAPRHSYALASLIDSLLTWLHNMAPRSAQKTTCGLEYPQPPGIDRVRA